MWFAEFKKHWLPEHEHQMRKNFETCRMNRLKGMFCQARKKFGVNCLSIGRAKNLRQEVLKQKKIELQKMGKLCQDVSAVDLFMYTYQKKDKSWVDSKSSQAYEKFTTKWKEVTSSKSTNNSGDAPKIS